MKNHLLVLFVFLSFQLYSQTHPFEISLEAVSIDGIGGIQSFAFGQGNGKWLIVGGRLDGLHRRQPWASFDLAGHNNQLWVIDPENKKFWTASLSGLNQAIEEHLRSTNMQFYQEGNYLYCIGGYGYSTVEDNHTTFDKLTAINLEGLIGAIINGEEFSPYFRQISDPQFQVTGGRLRKINNEYHLMGGQKFIGRYNPMGPDHGQGFEQEYTDAIRVFHITDNGNQITIEHITSHIDDQLHRRDYNAESQIMPDGKEGLTMFSGVFQPDINLPFLNCVNIDENGFRTNNDFQQFYNHYHCPVIPLFSEENNEMHTLFFGGIAQYYDQNGTMVQDNNVPFVKTIARVSRDSGGNMTEHLLPNEMPGLLGAGAEFISNPDIAQFNNHVFKLDSIENDPQLLGYIFGGISSSASNVFFINTGTQSEANAIIYKVYINKSTLSSNDLINQSDIMSIRPLVYPNPNSGNFQVELFTKKAGSKVELGLWNEQKTLLLNETHYLQDAGKNNILVGTDRLIKGGLYFISIKIGDQLYSQQIILEK